MSDPFRTPADYELFLYSLTDRYPSARSSTLVFVRRGATLARVVGEIHFVQQIKIVVRERLLYNRLPLQLDWYGYEVWQGQEKLYWYDSQPHPNDPTLARTHPHHKHVPPDIKHNRIPAPELTFTAPNLPFLIEEIETTLLTD
jgi:hypothetical protein